jgi:hypothetical protein
MIHAIYMASVAWYSGMPPENRNSGARVDVHWLGKQVPAEMNTQSKNRKTTVSMQRRGKHTSITIEELLGNGVFCWGRPEAI